MRQKTLPFRIIVDTAESHPFGFTGLTGQYRDGYRPLVVQTVRRCLGRYPDSFGDYSVEGFEPKFEPTLHGISVAVERKSIDDAHSTILGFTDGHRERFESELSNLATCTAAMVVVECDLCELINSAPEFGKRTAQQNAKTMLSSVLAYQQDYGVPWLFAGSRRMAEVATFRFLERFWRKHHGQE